MILKARFFISNTLRILKKHLILTLLMITLMTMSLILLCFTFYQNAEITKSVDDYNETFGNKTYYFMCESLDDTDYYTYLDDNNIEDYKRLLNFRQTLNEEEAFNYISLNSQFLEIYNTEIPDMFLYGYEQGYAQENIYQMDGTTYYPTKTIQVSESFFEEFDIKISDGRLFYSDDYICNKKEIPVLLGCAYKSVFSVGDTFLCNYLTENINCKVIGFVNENSFFYESSDDNFISCERYIIMPSMYSDTSSPAFFDKILLLQNVNGIISSTEGNTVLYEKFDNILEECKLSKWDIYITSSYDQKTQSLNNTIETYSSMTSEVSNHFKLILIALVIFTIISLTVSICGFVREQHHNYGVYILCGSSYSDLSINISMLTGLIILISTVIATLLLFILSYSYIFGLIAVWIIAFGIWLFITAITIIYLRKMSLKDIIGGKE